MSAIPSFSSASSAKSYLQSLQSEKTHLESHISQLTSNNVDGGLVDESGFPRSDVDVHGIREIRNQLARAQNDYKALMSKVEKAMLEYHRLSKLEKANQPKPAGSTNNSLNPAASISISAENQPAEKKIPSTHDSHTPAAAAPSASSSASSSSSSASSSSSTPSSLSLASLPEHLEAFYSVDEVSAHSPASEAGLCVGDRILVFGSLTKEIFSNQAMAAVTQASINRPLRVVVERAEVGRVILQLIPMKWEGRGLLGCHLK